MDNFTQILKITTTGPTQLQFVETQANDKKTLFVQHNNNKSCVLHARSRQINVLTNGLTLQYNLNRYSRSDELYRRGLNFAQDRYVLPARATNTIFFVVLFIVESEYTIIIYIIILHPSGNGYFRCR